MDRSETLRQLDAHFARQLGCRPEDLAAGNQQLVVSEARQTGNPGVPPAPLWALQRENGWIVSVSPQAYSPAHIVLQELPGNQSPLSEPIRRRLHETVRQVAPVSYFYYGLQLYTDRESFRPCSSHPVRRLTTADLPWLREIDHPAAALLARDEPTDVYAAIANGEVRSYATLHRIPSSVWEISVATLAPYRRQNYAKSVVSAATEAALDAGRVPIYSCDDHNAASRRVAEALGYRTYAEDFVCLGMNPAR